MSRTGGCWVSRAKEPNLWRAKQIVAKLGFTEEQREGERLSFSEQVERQAEKAERRAKRYEQYREIADEGSDNLTAPSSTDGDYSPANPWDAPGMSASDFI